MTMNGFISFAVTLNGPNPGADLSGSAIAQTLADDELAWVHLSATDPASAEWIEDSLAYLPAPVRSALVAGATRPHVTLNGDGALVILRGVNTNAGADPEDMVSIRLWIDPARIISLSRRPLASVSELREMIGQRTGPAAADEFLVALVGQLNGRIVSHADTLDAQGEAVEDSPISGSDLDAPRSSVTDVRRALVILRRFLRPQRDAVAVLASGRLSWIDDVSRMHLAEAQDTLTRTVEDLDALSERMAVARDEIASMDANRLNRNLYRLSVISAVFLPLGFLTGLMGINLGGMPGADAPNAFWFFSGGLGVMLVALLGLLWRFRRS